MKIWWVLAPNERTVAAWRRERGIPQRQAVRLACRRDTEYAEGRRWGPDDEVVELHGGPRRDRADIELWLRRIGRPADA